MRTSSARETEMSRRAGSPFSSTGAPCGRRGPAAPGSLALLALGAAVLLGVAPLLGCVDLEPTEGRLQSFLVTLAGPNQATGTSDAPLPLVSGRLCGRTACQDPAAARCPAGEQCVGYCETTGELCDEDADCRNRQACVLRCSARLLIDVEAVGNDGGHHDYTGPVHLDVTPGFLPPSQAYVWMEDGWLEDVPVYLSGASGRTNIWVEHDGYQPRPYGADPAREGECADGIDNDDDGLVDRSDSGCYSADDPVEGPDFYGECNNGRDDDGNGLVDLADPGCQDAFDDLEAPVTQATGVSPVLWFDAPDIRSVQYSPSIIHSALEGEDVTVSVGDLVVTSVTNSGLYLSDLQFHRAVVDGNPGFYNSIFLFTWSTPEGIVQGDILCRFGGGVVEFQGNTQITFPSYEPFYPRVPECAAERARLGLDETANRNDALAALGLLLEETDATGKKIYRFDLDKLTVDITSVLVPAYHQIERDDGSRVWRPVLDFNAAVDENACALEPYESALVRIENVDVSTVFVECDQNQNGSIDVGDESNCRNECQDDPLCTELASYERYKQWSGFVDEKFKMYVNQEMLLEQVPLRIASVGLPDEDGRCTFETFWFGDHQFRRYQCPPLRYASVRGNLRQVYLCNKDYREGGCPLQLFSLTPTGDRDVVPADVAPETVPPSDTTAGADDQEGEG